MYFSSTCSFVLVYSARGRYVCLTDMLVVATMLCFVRGGYGRWPGTSHLWVSHRENQLLRVPWCAHCKISKPKFIQHASHHSGYDKQKFSAMRFVINGLTPFTILPQCLKCEHRGVSIAALAEHCYEFHTDKHTPSSRDLPLGWHRSHTLTWRYVRSSIICKMSSRHWCSKQRNSKWKETTAATSRVLRRGAPRVS